MHQSVHVRAPTMANSRPVGQSASQLNIWNRRPHGYVTFDRRCPARLEQFGAWTRTAQIMALTSFAHTEPNREYGRFCNEMYNLSLMPDYTIFGSLKKAAASITIALLQLFGSFQVFMRLDAVIYLFLWFCLLLTRFHSKFRACFCFIRIFCSFHMPNVILSCFAVLMAGGAGWEGECAYGHSFRNIIGSVIGSALGIAKLATQPFFT